MGICCAQGNLGAAKKASTEVFEDELQKAGSGARERSGRPVELNSHNRDVEMYLENSKLLLSSNPEINVIAFRKRNRKSGMTTRPSNMTCQLRTNPDLNYAQPKF
eukprot:TRINITY_DN755_c0_g1_i1.p5 TRINITY_DN755_c0_g1~~TRINITY_DN755_c0_g1_i1.p5  ORF type:complete len:105 (+),score=18.51 TRINITY_DN755_c0_g1_i1:75-389(+)